MYLTDAITAIVHCHSCANLPGHHYYYSWFGESYQKTFSLNPNYSRGDNKAKKETGCRVWGVGCGEKEGTYHCRREPHQPYKSDSSVYYL